MPAGGTGRGPVVHLQRDAPTDKRQRRGKGHPVQLLADAEQREDCIGDGCGERRDGELHLRYVEPTGDGGEQFEFGAVGQSFTYDGFGNLTNVNVISGSAPIYSANPDPATNRLGCSDANGNSNVAGICGIYGNIYDVENRLVSSSASSGAGASYTYAPGNKRVWRGAGTYNADTGQWSTDEVTFWAPNGQKLGTYQVTAVLGCQFASPQCGNAAMAPEFYASQTGTYYYFGGRMVKNASAWVYGDRLGSIGKYYPYGQERPSATQNGTEKFTGYLRDSETGLDYAEQRYEQPGTGRFLTPDRWPTGAPNALTLPDNWNRYSYVGGDPVNRTDPSGLCSPDENPPCYSTTGTGTMGGGLNGSPGLGSPHPPGPVDDGDNQTAAQIQGRKAASVQQKVINELPDAVGVAEALLSNPDCANLFQPLDGSVSAAAVLFDLFNGVYYGSITVGDIKSRPGTSTSAAVTPGVINDGTGGTRNAAYIVINDLAGTFVSGDLLAQAVTLLHELGHAMNDIFGPGTSVIQADGPSVPNGVQKSMDNTALVDKACAQNGLPAPILLP